MEMLTAVDLIRSNTLSSEMAALDWYLVENRVSILVAGDGKTTTLNYLANLIKPSSKIITIEDRPNLQLYQENCIRAVTRPKRLGNIGITKRDLLKAAIRQKPDYIIIDDLTDEEVYTFFQAMAVGYAGLATIYARDVKDAIHTLEKEANVPRALIPNVSLIKVQSTINEPPESLREPRIRTMNTCEIVGIDTPTDDIIINEVYRWRDTEDEYVYSGRSILLERIARKSGLPPEKVREQVAMRKAVLEWVVRSGIREYPKVVDVIQEFYTDPEGVFNKAKEAFS